MLLGVLFYILVALLTQPLWAATILFSSGVVQGNFGPRAETNARCNASLPLDLTCTALRALVLYEGDTLGSTFAAESLGDVLTLTSSRISLGWGQALLAANVEPHFTTFWTGMDASGAALLNGNCLNWTTRSQNAKARVGVRRVSDRYLECSGFQELLCVCAGATTTVTPTTSPSRSPSKIPSRSPSKIPTTSRPSKAPTRSPSRSPSRGPSRAPIQSMAVYGSVTYVAAAGDRTCIYAVDTIRCFGDNSLLQAPRALYAPNLASLVASEGRTCFQAQGSLNVVQCVGRTDGDPGAFNEHPLPAPSATVRLFYPGNSLSNFVAGRNHMCGLAGYATSCFGEWDPYQQLGIQFVPLWDEFSLWDPAFNLVTKVAAGGFHTCIVRRLSNGISGPPRTAIYCEGRNTEGQLGIPYVAPSPGSVDAARGTNIYPDEANAFTDVVAGMFFTCGLSSIGDVFCWGGNEDHVVSILNLLSRSTPIERITGQNKVFAGAYHVCSLAASGNALRCWGRNTHGQLGLGHSNPVLMPERVLYLNGNSVTDVVTMSLGEAHTCAIFTNGASKCWGRNHLGQLGDGTYQDRNRVPE